MSDANSIRQEAEQARDRALEWLRTHPSTHSARKLDVKALIAAVDSLLSILPREGDSEWAIRYPSPKGYEFAVMSEAQARFIIRTHPEEGWELAYRSRQIPSGPWLMAPVTDGSDR